MNKKIISIGVAAVLVTFVASPALAGDSVSMNEARIKAKADYQNERVQLKEAKDTYRQVNTQERARTVLQQTINNMIKKLENAKVWVQNRKSISESDKNQALAQIEKELAWLKDKQAKLATMTQEELKNTAKEIREHVQLNHKKVKRMVGHVIGKRVEHSVEKVNGVVTKVENKLKELKAQGKNVSTYETRLADVKVKITQAQAKYQEAKNIYASIESRENADELFKNARTAVEEGNKLLRTASEQLKSLMHDMRIEFGAKVTTTSTTPSA